MLWARGKINSDVREFSLEFVDEISNKYVKQRLSRLPSGRPRRMSRVDSRQDDKILSNVGLEDSQSNSVNACAKVVPHMTHNAIVQTDRQQSISVH